VLWAAVCSTSTGRNARAVELERLDVRVLMRCLVMPHGYGMHTALLGIRLYGSSRAGRQIA